MHDFYFYSLHCHHRQLPWPSPWYISLYGIYMLQDQSLYMMIMSSSQPRVGSHQVFLQRPKILTTNPYYLLTMVVTQGLQFLSRYQGLKLRFLRFLHQNFKFLRFSQVFYLFIFSNSLGFSAVSFYSLWVPFEQSMGTFWVISYIDTFSINCIGTFYYRYFPLQIFKFSRFSKNQGWLAKPQGLSYVFFTIFKSFFKNSKYHGF